MQAADGCIRYLVLCSHCLISLFILTALADRKMEELELRKDPLTARLHEMYVHPVARSTGILSDQPSQ